MKSTSLAPPIDTVFLSCNAAKEKNKRWFDEIYVPVIIKSHGILERSDQIVWVHITKLDNPGACISEYQISTQLSDELVAQERDIFSINNQIDSLRKVMGLNISDIAAVLHVSRPTVYQWLASEVSIRNSHQERLNDIYDICLFWSRKKVGGLTAYLHKRMNNSSKSLIEVLADDRLDKNKIHYLLNQIEQSILLRKDMKSKNEILLKQYGFEDVSEDELEKNFNANIQSIG